MASFSPFLRLSTSRVYNCRHASTKSGGIKVALLGASGGIGQPLYDIVGTPGVAADLSHIDTKAKVTAFTGSGELHRALEGADIVVIPAGVPRKPGMLLLVVYIYYDLCLQ
jgi:malate dehydrogenase